MSKENEILVTVIIPTVANRSKELARAIKSVKLQTYKNIELIIVCDETITSPAACNVGMRKAKGKYIAFLGDDDIWFSDKIKLQVEAMEYLSTCALCTCWSSDMRFGMWRTDKAPLYVTHKDILKAFNYMSGSTYMIRNNTRLLFDENLLSGQEYDFALRLLNNTGNFAVCIPRVLVRQYSTEGQISTNWYKKVRGIYQLAQRHGKDYTLFDWGKMLGLLGLYTAGFVLGVRIYKLITWGKKLYE